MLDQPLLVLWDGMPLAGLHLPIHLGTMLLFATCTKIVTVNETLHYGAFEHLQLSNRRYIGFDATSAFRSLRSPDHDSTAN